MPFEKLAEDVLPDLLRDFYYGARTKNNECYSRSALKGLHAGLQRHLESEPHCKKFNLARDSSFTQANHVYTGYLSKLRKDRLDTTKHREPILPGDMARLYDTVFGEACSIVNN